MYVIVHFNFMSRNHRKQWGFWSCIISSPEWQGEIWRASSRSLHGSGQGDQTHCTDRLYQVCLDTHVRDGDEGMEDPCFRCSRFPGVSGWFCGHSHSTASSLSRSSSSLRLRKLWCNLYGIPVTTMKNWNRLTTPWLRWQLFFPDHSADLRDRLLFMWVCFREDVASLNT